MRDLKKTFTAAVVSMILALSFAPVVFAAEDEAAWKKEEAANRTIKIGYDGGICLATAALAHVKGFFAEEGLKTELVKVPTGETQRDAVGAGKIDTGGNHIAAWLVPTVNGVNMQFVCGVNTGCQSLYVLADSPVKKTADLKGKTIALPNGIGNSSHNITLRFLGHDKLNPKDFKFAHIEQGAVILAMQNGQADAATMGDQFAKKFVQDGTLRVIRSITYDDDFKNEPCCIFAINTDFIKKNPITSKKLTRAYLKANIWYENNKEEAVKILLDNKWVSGSYEYCLFLANELYFGMTQKVTEETLRDVIKDYKQFGLIKSDMSDKDILKTVWNPLVTDREIFGK